MTTPDSIGGSEAGLNERPRLRLLASGWFRHDGFGMPDCLDGVAVDTLRRSGSAAFLNGLPANVHTGWMHTGFSSDVLFWRPTASVSS